MVLIIMLLHIYDYMCIEFDSAASNLNFRLREPVLKINRNIKAGAQESCVKINPSATISTAD